MKQVIAYLYSLLIVLITFAVTVMVYLAFFDLRNPPIRFVYTHPVALSHPAQSRAQIKELASVKPGGLFYTYREFCITHLFIIIRNERWLVPGKPGANMVALPLLPARITQVVGKCESLSFPVDVPLGTAPGEYDYVANVVFMLPGNPIAAFQYTWPKVRVRVK